MCCGVWGVRLKRVINGARHWPLIQLRGPRENRKQTCDRAGGHARNCTGSPDRRHGNLNARKADDNGSGEGQSQPACYGRRDDGYRELESLVAFAGHGDTLELGKASVTRLTVEGLAAEGWGVAPADETNLIIRALRCLEAHIGISLVTDIRLHKNLPIAGGWVVVRRMRLPC